MFIFLFHKKTQRDFKTTHKVLSIMSLVLITLPIITISFYLFNNSEKNVVSEINLISPKNQKEKDTKFRDIYYLILDGYTGSFALKEHLILTIQILLIF